MLWEYVLTYGGIGSLGENFAKKISHIIMFVIYGDSQKINKKKLQKLKTKDQ